MIREEIITKIDTITENQQKLVLAMVRSFEKQNQETREREERALFQRRYSPNRIRSSLYSCPVCGANLDPGEVCDCRSL